MEKGNIAHNAITGGRRIWVPILAVSSIIALAVAESQLARSLPNEESLDSGTVIEFGPEGSMSVEVSEGWELNRAETMPDFRVSLSYSGTTLDLSAAKPGIEGSRIEPQQYWDGLDRILDITREYGIDVDLGEPAPYAEAGEDTMMGDLQVGSQSGFAVVMPSESGTEAVYAQVLSSDGIDDETQSATEQLISSLRFSAEGA